MAASKAVFIHSPDLDRYPYPPDCPFRTERAGMTRSILASMGLLSGPGRREVAPEPAPRDTLERFHSALYLDVLADASHGEMGPEGLHMGLGTPDCPVFAGLYDYAVLACGATLTGARLILSGEACAAFNPSGGYHHAGPDFAAGFCYVNDSALACLVLAAEGRRVFYLDVDAHHGDGVENAFYDRADVMTLSFHESGRTLFPGTGFEYDIGRGDGEGYAANVPLPVGTYDAAFMRAFEAVAEPLIGAFDPDVVVMELGMDGLAGDPLAHLSLTNNVYADAIGRVLDFGKPVLAVGGGGYHVANTARAWALAWTALCGQAADQTMGLGLGGVMLETTDWQGGLRDRVLAPDQRLRAVVDPVVDRTIEVVRKNVFGFHGL